MDISKDIENLVDTIKTLQERTDDYIQSNKHNKNFNYFDATSASIANDIIDVEQIHFSDDETWLYKPENVVDKVTDLRAWLHEDAEVLKDLDFHTKHFTLMREFTKLDGAKKIDTRTFTRPKKRYSRPSLDFNESQFRIEEFLHNTFTNDVDLTENIVESQTNPGIPLHFNLTDPSNNNNVFKVPINSDVDSELFQDMSPISLVNSSIFSSIMENSYVKDDQVSRDADCPAIIKSCDILKLKSSTGSCSSVDSDTPEGFSNQSLETTCIENKKRNIENTEQNQLNATFITNNSIILNKEFYKDSAFNNTGLISLEPRDIDSSTYISSNKLSSIYKNCHKNSSAENLNETFSIRLHNDNRKMDDLNSTFTVNDELNMDSNKLNYTKRRHNYTMEEPKPEIKCNTFLKRNRCSLGSSDSLDCASSLSNSSNGMGSSKMLNMAEVDAIVLQQEQRLQQVMSTPKPSAVSPHKLLERNNISPIRQLDQDHFSDSEASSNDDYITVGSGSSKSIASGNSDSVLVIQPKCLTNIRNEIPSVFPKNIEGTIKSSYIKKPAHHGSYTVLHRAKMEQQSLQKNTLTTNGSAKTGAQSNLKSMNTNLKGSYTQLKPVFTNLPHTAGTNIKGLANIKPKQTPDTIIKTEVSSTLKDLPITAPRASSTKLISKPSGLPRPISAIPRPTGSKIPGIQSMRSGIPQSRSTSKVNVGTELAKKC